MESPDLRNCDFPDSQGEVHSLLLALEETTLEPDSLPYSSGSFSSSSGYVTQRTHDHPLKQRLESESQHGTNFFLSWVSVSVLQN